MSNVAIVQDGYNKEDALSTLKVVTKPIPKAPPGRVVVHITVRPINPSDFIIIRMGSVINGTPGADGFGIVHEVGEGVTNFHEGQRVVPLIAFECMKGNGSFQKYACIEADFVWPVPDDMPDEAAAQFIGNPLTTYSVLKVLQVPKGEYLIQNAAGGSIGKQVISLAKHWGIKTINIVRRSEQKAELKALGADEVICSAEEDVVARAKEITGGKGAWGALDAVCGTMTATLASTVRNGGQVLLYGMLGANTTTLNAMDLFRGVSVTGWSQYRKVTTPEQYRTLAAEVAPLVIAGIIPVAEVEKFDLTDFKQAMSKAEEPGRSGKILLVSA